ncbi:MAG: hypothetical protein FJZ13_04910 [Candidatus Omnitrophica bacterium]|nr:hypothetical protein [Candidatus Omnitrophota bacterium]
MGNSKNFYFYIIIFIFTFLIFNLLGCAAVTEGAKGFMGISTKAVEDTRKEAITKIFNCSYNTCYTKTEKMLGHGETYIYAKDSRKKMIAIYLSRLDTTPVGVFFKELGANKTQIEVASPSTYAKEVISKRIFLGLAKALDEKRPQVIERKKGPRE